MSKLINKPRIASAALTDSEIAPDLVTLMERLERARKFLYVEREYIKLTLVGLGFIIAGSMIGNHWAMRGFLMFIFIATPWLYGLYTLPLRRLAAAFRNETMPFLLRDYGRWNYAHETRHFPRDAFFKLGFVNPRDGLAVSSVMTGERFGVPMQLAVCSVWAKPRYGIYRGHKAIFAGWTASIRLPELPQLSCLILPNQEKPLDPAHATWQASAFTATHQVWTADGQAVSFSAELMSRLSIPLLQEPRCRLALSEGVLWLLVPGDEGRFNLVRDFKAKLNEPEIYQKARSQLAELFVMVDKIIWPQST